MNNSSSKPTPVDERRTTERFLRKESVSIQILLPDADGACSAKVVASESIDISGRGLRLLLPVPLESGRIYDICVELKDDPRRFLLTGETRWCRYSDDRQGHEVGIEVLDGEGTDSVAWFRGVGAEPDGAR